MSAVGRDGRSVLVLGGTGLVGGELVRQLVEEGAQPSCLTRRHRGEVALTEAGARAIPGDLVDPDRSAWRGELGDADVIIHSALGPLSPPVRPRQVRRHAAQAAASIEVVREGASAGATIVALSTGLRDLRIGRAAAALELPVAGDDRIRILRLPWIYGESGPMHWVSHGLEVGRFRVVGPGDNRWSLLSVADAARAVAVCCDLPSGIYSAAEAEQPTQRELVETVCARRGLRVPDHVPGPLAVATLGRPLAEALAESLAVETSSELSEAGWSPQDRWAESFAPEPQGEE